MEEPNNEKQDKNLSIFRAITNFVKCLNDCYGPKQKSLQLYSRLIQKTTLADDVPIQRHLEAFKKFCETNKESIMAKDKTKFINSTISYNEKVYINIENIFKLSDRSEESTIWKHLLAIYALIDPHSRAKEKLKDVLETDKKNVGKESEFLHNIFDKVGSNIDNGSFGQPGNNPMETVSSMMSSGLFTDIVGSMSQGLENGELDLGRLMGSMQGMVSSIGEMANDSSDGADPQMAGMLNQMNQMMGNLNNATSNVANENDIIQGRQFADEILKGRENSTSTKENTEPTYESTAYESMGSGSNVEENKLKIEEIIEEVSKDNFAESLMMGNSGEEIIGTKIENMNKKSNENVQDMQSTKEMKSTEVKKRGGQKTTKKEKTNIEKPEKEDPKKDVRMRTRRQKTVETEEKPVVQKEKVRKKRVKKVADV